jgi:2-polyprenyl-3-methyl-5-hydroxy-6-metoxy-1,4-benzoquinol methylase
MSEAITDPNKLGEIENAEKSLAKLTAEGTTNRVKPFGIQWPAVWWLKWATIHHAFRELGIPQGARVLDIGSGTGWSTLLFAEAGYEATGVDIAPANVEIARLHAARWNSGARFLTGDMDTLDLGERFHAVLMFDALHHVDDPAAVVGRVAHHLEPGGWALFGEPSLLHRVSPDARAVSKEKGWIENGIGVRKLRRWCTEAGMPETRRFFEPTRPYSDRVRQFGWEAVRLVAANIAFAPSYHVWLGARKG